MMALLGAAWAPWVPTLAAASSPSGATIVSPAGALASDAQLPSRLCNIRVLYTDTVLV